jgi:hypothetical protein
MMKTSHTEEFNFFQAIYLSLFISQLFSISQSRENARYTLLLSLVKYPTAKTDTLYEPVFRFSEIL